MRSVRKARSTSRPGRSGGIEFAVDGSQDEAGGLGALPAQLLPLILRERDPQIGQGLPDERSLSQRAVREGALETGHRPLRDVDGVALLREDRAELGPRCLGLGPETAQGLAPDAPDAPDAPMAPGRAADRRARHSDSRMLIEISSQWRPSRRIASRSRPSTRKPDFS